MAMTVKEYFGVKKRMTGNSCDGCAIDCVDCPISYINNGVGIECFDLEANCPEKAEELVRKWAEEHPRKTMLQDFLEKYPNAPHRPDGTPIACPFYMGYAMCSFCNTGKCFDCWNRPLEDD